MYIYIKKELVYDVVFTKKTRHTQAIEKTRNVVKPKEVSKQLTVNDGLEKAYATAHDISITYNTLYIDEKIAGRASDWHDNITKVPTLWHAAPRVNQYRSIMFGMNALPYVQLLARSTDMAHKYASMALKTAPLVGPEYGETAMKLDASLGSVSMGLQAVPYVANMATSIDTKNIWCLTIWAIRSFWTNIVQIHYNRKCSKQIRNVIKWWERV